MKMDLKKSEFSSFLLNSSKYNAIFDSIQIQLWNRFTL